MVTEPTQLYCALFDHMFIQKGIMQDMDVHSTARTRHFSNYNAVIIRIQIKTNDRVFDFDFQLQ